MPDLHGWITQQIDETERTARACTATDWRHAFDGIIVDRDTDGWQHAPDQARIASVAYERTYWSTTPPHSPDADHIVTHDPDNVLRRCAADRKILEHHAPIGGGWPGHYACNGCGYDGGYCPEPNTEHVNDCPTLLALAEGYGLTEEQRAALDRPEAEQPPRKPGFGGMPDSLVEEMVRVSLATVPPGLRGPNWKARP